MEESYVVFFGSQRAGTVRVQRQGLYYRFLCRCQLSGDILCRLQVSCGEHKENLGVVVPIGDGFGLDTKLPIKRLGEGTLSFALIPKHETVAGTFCPIYPEEPFSYIAKLKDAYLARQEGQIGVVFHG